MVKKFLILAQNASPLVIAVLLLSCSGAHWSFFRSGSTTVVDKAPYYDGDARAVSDRIGYLPITFDVRLQKHYDDSKRHLLQPILDEMNAFMEGLGVASKLDSVNLPIHDAPDIYVGNRNAFDAPTSSYSAEKKAREMVIYQYEPSEAWNGELARIAEAANVDHVLYITIGFSEYFIRQKGFFGGKVLELGTGYTMPVGWLSDQDKPADVLHVAGALLDKKGKVLRAGAEGIVAKNTGFLVSLLGLRETIGYGELQKILLEERREDLPTKPLKWKTALQNLIAQLLHRDEHLIIE